MTRAWLLPTLACTALAVAGCVEPDESRGEPACELQYVTTHWTGTAGVGELRPALEAAGYTWLPDETEGVARLATQTRSVEGVVSYRPGVSGEDLILSFEETSPALSGDPTREARRAAEIVNATSPDANLTQWIEGVHDAGCGPLVPT